jgi:hypothetical protein
MPLFGKCECSKLETSLEELKKQFRLLRVEMTETSDKVYRHMKRTEMRERAALSAGVVDTAPDVEQESAALSPGLRALYSRRRGRNGLLAGVPGEG